MAGSAEDYLAHYGVKGMKWGRRRNKTGGYDYVGRKVKGGTLDKPDVSKMSDEELRNRIGRIKMETEYSQLTKRKPGKAEKFVKTLVKKRASETLERATQQGAREGTDLLVQKLKKELKKK